MYFILGGILIPSKFSLHPAHPISFEEIIMLDRIQKRKTLSEAELKSLRIKGLIEGKKPNIIISASIAQTIGQKAHYTINKAFTKEQYFIFKNLSLKIGRKCKNKIRKTNCIN